MQRKTNRGKRPSFQAALQSDGTLELLVYEDIGENFWTDGGITAKSVKDQIDFAGKFARLSIRINSPGGDAFEGIAIYNVLRALNKPIEVCVDGIAASAASVIAMAGDSIIMAPSALMMIHDAWGQCMGYAEDMLKTAEGLDKVSDAIGKVYVTRTGKTAPDVAAMMDAETWMTAEECLDQGFCTEIASEPDEQVEENAIALARGFKALRRMKHVPAALARSGECECDCESCAEGICSECTNPDCVDQNCKDCPMQDSGANASAAPVSIEAARAALEEREGAFAADAVSIDAARDRVDALESVLRLPMD